MFKLSLLVQGGALRAPRGAVPDAAACARAGRAACRPVPARRAAATDAGYGDDHSTNSCPSAHVCTTD